MRMTLNNVEHKDIFVLWLRSYGGMKLPFLRLCAFVCQIQFDTLLLIFFWVLLERN